MSALLTSSSLQYINYINNIICICILFNDKCTHINVRSLTIVYRYYFVTNKPERLLYTTFSINSQNTARKNYKLSVVLTVNLLRKLPTASTILGWLTCSVCDQTYLLVK